MLTMTQRCGSSRAQKAFQFFFFFLLLIGVFKKAFCTDKLKDAEYLISAGSRVVGRSRPDLNLALLSRELLYIPVKGKSMQAGFE